MKPRLLLVSLLLAINDAVKAWTFTAVLPTPGNPKARLNRLVVAELQDICNSCTVIGGRVRLELDNATPVTILEQSFGRHGVRSLRVVAGERQIKPSVGENSLLLSQITPEVLDAVASNLEETLSVFQLFGNQLSNDDCYSAHVTCQKLHGKMIFDSYQELSPSKLATEIVLGFRKRFQWIPEPKKARAQLRFHVMIWEEEQAEAVGIRIELVTLVIPDDARANLELPRPGMKRVEAWALVKSADIQPHHIVLDPMCGKGTFLIEAATFSPATKFLGVDMSRSQLTDALTNAQAMKLEEKIQLIEGDSRKLALPDDSVDRILCCPPFGRQFERNQYEQNGSLLELYNDLLIEWYRVLKPAGRMVLLIDKGNLEDLTKAIQDNTNCCIQCLRPFRLGLIQAFIIVVDSGCSETPDPRNMLPWEIGSGLGKTNTRANWEQLRALELPSLVPVATGT